MKKRVLILCTGNSCRSQMAEGLWRSLGGADWEVHSAGSRPAGYVHPRAVQVMAERGIDISTHRSKAIAELAGLAFDLVITVCDSARETCPMPPGARERLHWPFRDPAAASGGESSELAVFRAVRDEIAAQIAAYLDPRADRSPG